LDSPPVRGCSFAPAERLAPEPWSQQGWIFKARWLALALRLRYDKDAINWTAHEAARRCAPAWEQT
jgi:hypothetical protein